MALKFITVHATQKGCMNDIALDYTKRIQRYIPMVTNEIIAPKKWNQLPIKKLKAMEGEAILKSVQPNDQLILLDEKGKQYSSTAFSSFFEQLHTQGGGNVVFCVGGAYGFSNQVYERANRKLSLSKMTFSHQMVRLFFLEQVYRALTIIHGHPYHNE